MNSSLALRTTTFTTTTAACWELRTPASARARVRRLSIIQATATACTWGLGRPQAIGLTPVNVLFQRLDYVSATDVSVMNASLSWATSPTVPLIFHERFNSSAAVGDGIIWEWSAEAPLVVPVSFGLVLWNITTTVAADVNCLLDE